MKSVPNITPVTPSMENSCLHIQKAKNIIHLISKGKCDLIQGGNHDANYSTELAIGVRGGGAGGGAVAPPSLVTRTTYSGKFKFYSGN